MTWDYFAFLAENTNQEETLLPPQGLSGGFVDEVSVRFFKESARCHYMTKAGDDITFPDLVSQTVPDFSSLPSSAWLALQVDFELLTPWYSKDDRVFHLLDNPVRKDRVLGVPFMAASSWKGMLRWACRMHAGLLEHLEKQGGRLDGWRDPDWILHLFGNEKGEGEEFSRGALAFYPTWFDRIGFEVINPHSRERRAGTQPIYYEVVPPGVKGTLTLLYAPWVPWPEMKPAAKAEEVLPMLLEAIEALLTTYGISAKRTVGWGTAEITKWRAFHKTGGNVEKNNRADLEQEVQTWLSKGTKA